jgi:prepilin-type N-terminal cleavage/methylation domain-containing protein
MSRLRRVADDRGDTLIEVLVGVIILGVAAVAIVSGMAVSIKVSDIHRKEANAGAYVRNYAEAVEAAVAGGGYVAGTTGYAASLYTPPLGYAASLVSKQCWTASSTWGSCSTDYGVQQLTLQVSSSDQRAVEKLVVIVRKPCGPGSSCT